MPYYQLELMQSWSKNLSYLEGQHVVSVITEVDAPGDAVLAAHRWAIWMLPILNTNNALPSNPVFTRVRAVRISTPKKDGSIESHLNYIVYKGGNTSTYFNAEGNRQLKRLREEMLELYEHLKTQNSIRDEAFAKQQAVYEDPTPVSEVFRPGLVKLLVEADIKTMGHLLALAAGEKFTFGGNNIWAIPGIGAEYGAELSDGLAAFRRKKGYD